MRVPAAPAQAPAPPIDPVYIAMAAAVTAAQKAPPPAKPK